MDAPIILLNAEVIAVSWPLAYGIYFPVAFREGGERRLWHDTKILVIIMILFFLIVPYLYVYYIDVLNAAGLETIVFPFSVFAAASSTYALASLKANIGVQCLLSTVLALFVVLLGAWIA